MMHALQKFLLFHLLTCLGLSALGSEIINGKKASGKSMRYMASVQNDRGHICGGFLISEDFVLTAAHCYRRNPTSVVLGTHNLKKVDNKTMRYPVKMCKHPDYVKAASGNDIMLLKLTKKARLNNRIKVIQLPRSDRQMKDNTTCQVAGWGSTKTGGTVVDVLQVVDVPFVDLEVCKKKWKEKARFNLPENVICAGGYYTNKGACQGDSGGPLLYSKMAVGIVSFNRNNSCTYPDVPNVYTNISKYLPWINKILKKKDC